MNIQLGNKIPAGEKALVFPLFGKTTKEVIGPKTLPFWETIRFFNRFEVNHNQKYTIYDEKGKSQNITGPTVVFVHPDGNIAQWNRLTLQKNEITVVRKKDGSLIIYKGSDLSKLDPNTVGRVSPEVWVSPEEEVISRSWTGKDPQSDRNEKTPRAIQTNKVRISDNQTYFDFEVRTSDNSVMFVSLMIFYSISDIEKIIFANDDPLGVMYNLIQSALVESIAKLSFDEFKKDTGSHFSQHPIFTQENEKDVFLRNGLTILRVVLREWRPADSSVQKILERAAITQTEKEVDKAQHERSMQQLQHEETELKKSAELGTLKQEAATQEGLAEGAKLFAVMQKLTEESEADESLRLKKLFLASKADTLHLGSDLLE